MKSIPVFNYIKVVILFVITCLVVFILVNYYNQKIQYERRNEDTMSFLSNVKYEELSSFLVENHDVLIYMAPSSDSSLDVFEEDLKQYILDLELEKEFIYLDSSSFSNYMYDEFKDKFFSSDALKESTHLNSRPSFFAVKDGKIIDVLYTDSSKVTMDMVEQFVNMYVVIQ